MQARSRMGLWEAVSIAVGTMIGASIFSIFGLGAKIAGPNLPLVFVISGVLALLVAYSYAHLGARIVSNAGPLEFILRGIGDNAVTGTLSILMWMSYVISIALFAKGFAGYLLPLLQAPLTPLAMGLAEAAVIFAFTGLNFFGSRAVGRAEFFIVLVKLSVLGLFVALGIWSIDPDRITPSFDPVHGKDTLFAVAVFFLSYMGFGLVTNASENIEAAGRNVPRAIYISILIVTVVYVSVAAVAVGNLPLADLIRAQDFALAEAARPFLGELGYVLVSFGALFSIASALNATLYGGANVAYALAREGELPTMFERKAWFGSPEGLYVTAGLGLGFALGLDLNGVAAVTSAVLMSIYLFVLLAHYRLAPRYGGSRGFILFAFVMVLTVFLLLMDYQWRTNRHAFVVTWLVFGLSLVGELLFRRVTLRGFVIRDQPASTESKMRKPPT